MRPTLEIKTARPAFTLVEMLIVLLMIAVLIGLLLVGFSHAIRLARGTAGAQSVRAIGSAVEQFKRDFDILPPMVKDGFTGTPDSNEGPLLTLSGGRRVPHVYSLADAEDREFLQGQGGAEEYRFSIYSLPYYLMGALDKSIDGVDGPGAKPVQRDGMFDRLTNDTYPALYDPRVGGLNSVVPGEGRIELQDRNGVSFRYYRWLEIGPGDTGYNANDPRANLAIPDIVGDAAENTSLGSARYAIVAAGADGLFGTFGVEAYPGQPVAEREDRYAAEAKHGKRYSNDLAAQDAARRDNIVEVGTDD